MIKIHIPQLVDLATSEGAVRQTTTSAFAGDGMRSNRVGEEVQDEEQEASTAEQHPSPKPPAPALSTSSSASSGGGFGGGRFWAAMRAGKVEEDVRGSLAEAKRELRRKGAPPLQVELDLKLARFLVGLGGSGARAEVSELVSAVVEAAASLPLPEDRLAAAVEAAQVVGAVGFARKRTLMLWQAVELSKSMERPDGATLDIAKKALEPADLDEHTGACFCGGYRWLLTPAITACHQSDQPSSNRPLPSAPSPWHRAGSSPPSLGCRAHRVHRGRACACHPRTPARGGVGLRVDAAA